MIAQITQNAKTYLDLTSVSVKRVTMEMEEDAKVCMLFSRVIVILTC